MPTINPEADVSDREVGCSPQWPSSYSGRDPKALVYPSHAMPERRRLPTVEQTAGKAAAEMPGVTPSQWLRQWCCLDEQT